MDIKNKRNITKLSGKGGNDMKRKLKCWEKPIPKNQKRHLSICPHCHKKFYYWQYASNHAQEKKHYGDYSI
jgi:hypothetical protein